MEQKYSCEIIKDLLPMYQDDICSKESRTIIEAHLSECNSCKELVEKMNNNTVEDTLFEERTEVLANHAKKERRRTTTVGIITAAILMIPLIVCLICNLAVGHALDWFFIVFASLLVFASLTVVPLLANHNRLLWSLCAFTLSLVGLLGVIALYTHGNWFGISVVPSLYGLTLIFFPYILYKMNLPGFLGRMKGFLSMTVDSLFTYYLLYICGSYATNKTDYNRIAYGIATICIIFSWVIFLILRYLKISRWSRAGIVTILFGFFGLFINQTIDYLILQKWVAKAQPNLFCWTIDNVEANVFALIFGVCILSGIFLIATGIGKANHSK